MKMIDLPAQKEIIWHKMRTDLISIVPWFADSDLLLCPACCRPVGYDDCSVEHIVPKQALACDPVDVRAAVSQNERSGLTLLCRKPLVWKGKLVQGHGCNSWKGKHYDSYLRDLLDASFKADQLNTRHQVALFSAGYLALVRQFGFRVVLSPTGLLSRKQFFFPNTFLREIPMNCQMMITGEKRTGFKATEKAYWSEPFRMTLDGDTALIVLRNMGFRVPIAGDPSQSISISLPYLPSTYTFRPDLSTVFD